MKNLFCLFLFTLVFHYNSFSQTCSSTFQTQADIDNFATNFPNCTELYQLKIDSFSTVTNLNGLSQLTTIGTGGIDIQFSDLISLEGLNNVTYVKGGIIFWGLPFTNMNGFENLTTVDKEIIFNNNDDLVSLEGLENLTTAGDHLIFNDNDSLLNFSAFTNLTHIGNWLRIYGNDKIENLHGFENVTFFGGDITVGNSQALTTFEGLDHITSIVGKLEISYNDVLTNLNGWDSLTSIGGDLRIQENESLINLQGLDDLTSVGGDIQIVNNPVLTNLSGLENLTLAGDFLKIDNNNALENLNPLQNLTSLNGNISISYNSSLTSISGLGNVEGFSHISIWSNENLEICNQTNICNHLINGGNSNIFYNAPGCENASQIEDQCLNNLPYVAVDIFYDWNNNQIHDSDEVFVSDASIEVSPLGIQLMSNPNNGGVIFLDPGDYVFQFDPNTLPNWDLTTASTSYSVSLSSTNISDTISFGLIPNVQISEMVNFINAPPLRCGTTRFMEIHAKNHGTTLTNGTLWFQMDQQIINANFIDPPDTTIAPNIFGWHFENLNPGYKVTKSVELDIPAPPNITIGSSLSFETHTDYLDGNGIYSTTVFEYNRAVFCAYDPNDKLVHANSNNDFTLIDDDLIYTIRFQNTGNAEAYDIVIRDTLDLNLDPSTFRVLSSSHPTKLITTLEDNLFLKFNFENIYLPDSTTDFDASQGYVSYSIQVNEDIPSETSIQNTASIYFDFNPPIVTNTTDNNMVYDNDLDGFWSNEDCNDDDFNINPDAEEIPNNGIDEDCIDGDLMVDLLEIEDIEVSLFPNPVSEEFFIKTKNTNDLIFEIVDVNGRIIQSGKLMNTIHRIDFTENPTGVFFVKIINLKSRNNLVFKIIRLD